MRLILIGFHNFSEVFVVSFQICDNLKSVYYFIFLTKEKKSKGKKRKKKEKKEKKVQNAISCLYCVANVKGL
jgi:hypothetical protein